MLYIIRGLPGSGKSTFAKMLAERLECCHFEADMYFVRDGEYKFDVSLLGDAHNWCQSNVKLEILMENDCIVSNTFTTTKEIAPYVKMCKDNGTKYTIITMNGQYGSVHNVPQETMEKMKARFDYKLENIQ